MAFKDLKKRTNALQELQKKIEDDNKPSYAKDERIWSPTRDKAGNGFAIIRFLPAHDEEDMPFVKLYSHGFQDKGGWYIENSLTTLGQKDPCGQMNSADWATGDEELRNIVRKRSRKTNYYSNIYVVKDAGNPENEGKVFIFRYGTKIFEKIMDMVNGNEVEGRKAVNVFNMWEGANFELRVKKVAGYPNYDSSTFSAPGVLENFDDGQLESIYNREHKLQPLVAPDQFKTFDELQDRLDIVLGLKSAPAKGSSTAKKETVSIDEKPVFAKPPLAADDDDDESTEETTSDDDDESLSYFQSLVD